MPATFSCQELRMNIIEKSDEEILAIADPLWRGLVKHSNEGKYEEFVKNFSSSLALAMNNVVAGHQFANSELARSLSDEVDSLGIIHTVLDETTAAGTTDTASRRCGI